MLTGWERPSHWLVLAVVVVVLFGYKKLPEYVAIGRPLSFLYPKSTTTTTASTSQCDGRSQPVSMVTSPC